MRDDNPEGILVLKICIGAAFYNKYVKAEYKNDELQSKSSISNMFDNNEDQRALILNKMSKHINE